MQVEAQRYAAAVKPLGRSAESRQDFAAALFDAARPLVREFRPRNERDVQMLDAAVANELPRAGIDPEGKLGLFARERVKELAMLPWQAALFVGQVPLFAELWEGSNNDPWNSTRWPTIVEASSSDVSIQSNAGQMSPAGANYTYCYAQADSGTIGDFNLTVGLTIGTLGEQYHHLAFRHTNGWTGGIVPVDGYFAYTHRTGGGVQTLRLDVVSGGSRTQLGSVAKSWGTGTWKMRILAVGSALKVKAWQGAEPASWDIEVSNATHAAGVISLFSVNGNATTARPVSWDNLMVFAA